MPALLALFLLACWRAAAAEDTPLRAAVATAAAPTAARALAQITLVLQSSAGCNLNTGSSEELGGNQCLESSILGKFVRGVRCSSSEGLVFNTYSDSACNTTLIDQYILPSPFANGTTP